MRVAVIGAGAVGTRAARQLVVTPGVEVLVVESDRDRSEAVVAALGPQATAATRDELVGLDAVLLATPAPHTTDVRRLVEQGTPVVSVSDDLADVRALLELDDTARRHGVPVVVGAGFAPGLSCLLARHAESTFDRIDEIHVGKHGTGGPACARQHHQSLGDTAVGYHDGTWIERPGGSGRELYFFPDPVGAYDCYAAALPDPDLLVRAFPGIERVTSRISATRRDRLTARLPMLRPPHPEGGLGAIRVEVRGWRGGARASVVLGAIDRAAIAAGAVAAVGVLELAVPRVRVGCFGLADESVDATALLVELARRGVRAARFLGAGASEVG
jgi:hypothetical protein